MPIIAAITLSKESSIPLVVVETCFIPYSIKKNGNVVQKIVRYTNCKLSVSVRVNLLSFSKNNDKSDSRAVVDTWITFKIPESYTLEYFDEITIYRA